MKTTGIIRRIDDLGRFVIPKELRKTLRIKTGDSLEIFVENEDVILKKYSPMESIEDAAFKYVDSFNKVIRHNIIVTDIYAAREINTYGITSEDLKNAINKFGKKAIYIGSFDKIVSYLKENTKPHDLILTLGAGTITELGPMILK